jgi:hypothetical protein
MEQSINFYEIYDYYAPPFWQTTWFIVLMSIIVLTTVFILFFMYRARKKIPSWTTALQKLEFLRTSKLQTQSDFKLFYINLTSIIKNYLHERFGFTILDKTDDELVNWLESQHFDPILLETLKKITGDAVLVKFAKLETLAQNAQDDLGRAQSIVQKTVPQKTTQR